MVASLRGGSGCISEHWPRSAPSGDPQVRGDPALTCPLQQRTNTVDLVPVCFRARCLDLGLQGQESLVKGDLFRPWLMAVVEAVSHRAQPTPGACSAQASFRNTGPGERGLLFSVLGPLSG